MPIEIPHKHLFKPFYPTYTRPHSLFGQKYFQHEFQSVKWQRSSQNDQLKAMIRVLGKNLEFQKLEENSRNERAAKKVKNLRVVCQEKRQHVKASLRGDVQIVRNILVEHKEMQRLYQNQELSLANDNIKNRIFIKRKENDRLKYKLNVLQEKYKKLLFEQSRLEDRIKYDKYFQQPEEIKAAQIRPILDNSQTRVRAFKMISQCYKNMIDTLRKDELHYHPVLDSLEEDLSEQSKLIQHVILLAIPAQKKYQRLAQEYYETEEQTSKEMKSNLICLNELKTNVKENKKKVKQIVDQKIEEIYEPRKYIWSTTSMTELNQKREELYKIIKDLEVATVSLHAEEVAERIKNMEANNEKHVELLHRHQINLGILRTTEQRAKAMINEVTYNPDVKDISVTVNQLNLNIQFQKDVREECDSKIIFTGEIITRLNWALSNMVEVMRHVGSKRVKIRPTYPNEELNLPLLKFDFFPKLLIRPRPYIYNDKDDGLINLAKEKIKILMYNIRKPKPRADQLYCDLYVESVRKNNQDVIGKIEERAPVYINVDRPCQDDILCRTELKARSAQIVEAERIRREFM